jgi:DNA-binding CsgD family transcriptional regulator
VSTTTSRPGVETSFGDRSRTFSWRRRESVLLARVEEVIADAQRVLGEPIATPSPTLRIPNAIELVSTLTWAAIERLQTSPPARPIDVGRTGTLVVELQALADELNEHAMSQQTHRIAACEAGLARLHATRNTADLIDRVCGEILRSAGFERVLLSRVDDGVWRPWKHHFTHGHEFEEWFEQWLDTAIPLDELTLEGELLLNRRPALVDDAVTDPRVHRIVTTGRSLGYVVAPIVPGGKVVGFLHADYYPLEQRVDTVDRDLLWMFAEGFGQIYERTLMLERLQAQREQVRKTMGAATELMDDFCNAELELSRQSDGASIVASALGAELPPEPGHSDELTPREREVLQMIAVGATNNAIAQALVITEGTVKSHVKHILRKLGAANRSQAIASYLGGPRPS